jgi:glycosyltransferase involved in cell wall biosynthesis
MNNKISVSVALATFNGEKYLQQQLDSLAAQSELPAELVVGDDGSTDRTVEILEDFATRAPFPVRIERNATNLGYEENFLRIASRCHSDWIAFCDQDDFWLESKLAKVAHILNQHADVSLLVHDMIACDDQLRPRASRANGLWVSRKVGPLQGGYRVHAGCSMVFSRRLLDIGNWTKRPSFPGTKTKWSHDAWIGILGYAVATRYLCHVPLVLYRRHGDALTNHYSHGLPARMSRVTSTPPEFFRQAGVTFSEVSRWFAEYAEGLEGGESQAVLCASQAFRRRARIYDARAELYGSTGIIQKTMKLGRLVITDGYVADFGLRDHAKDVLRALMVARQ